MISKGSFLLAACLTLAACRSNEAPAARARGDAAPGAAGNLAAGPGAPDDPAGKDIPCCLPAENCDEALAEVMAAHARRGARGSPPATDVGRPPLGAPPPPPRSSDRPPVPAADATVAPPLPPALAAHLSRIPVGDGTHLVVQADATAVVGADFLRGAAQGVAAVVGREIPGDAGCMVELVAAIEAVTYVMVEGEGPDIGIALVDGGADLPGIVECAMRMDPELLPPTAMRDASQGYIEIDGHVAMAKVGPRTLAVGSTDLVRAARADAVPGSLADSDAFARARALAGPGAAYVAFFDSAGRPRDRGMPVRGGVSIRTSPRVGIAGTLQFGGLEPAGEALAEVAEVLDELRAERSQIVLKLGPLLGPAVIGDLQTVIDAALDARFVLQGGALSVDVWLPAGTTMQGLAGSFLQALPAALAVL